MIFENLSIKSYSEKIKNKELSATSVIEEIMQRISSQNHKLGAVLELNDSAVEQAKKMDSGESHSGKLAGVPILVKDNFCVEGMKATAGSRILENFRSPYTAHSIQRLINEGAIIIGKTNLDEFAMGSSNENSYFGPCKNPWDLERVPGGSSGGSAAAVAAGWVPVSIGSDTGGSIRQPASFCGVVGIKPSYGTISRFGMIAFASSLDQAGTFGRSVEDAARVLEVMIDKDVRDATNIQAPFANLKLDSQISLKGLKVGLAKQYMQADLNSDLAKALDKTIADLKSEGCEIVNVDLPHTEFAIPVYYLIAASEASSNLSRYDGVRYGLRDLSDVDNQPLQSLADFYARTRSHGFGNEVKRRILLGTFALSAGYYDAFYTKACQVRRLIAEDFSDAFAKCDFIIGPVSTSPAFKIGEKVNDPISMYYNDIFTTPASLAGLPSMSLPMALSQEKLPLGLQLIAPPMHDDKMILFASQLEALLNFKEVCRVD